LKQYMNIWLDQTFTTCTISWKCRYCPCNIIRQCFCLN